jgi:hypothetical protein
MFKALRQFFRGESLDEVREREARRDEEMRRYQAESPDEITGLVGMTTYGMRAGLTGLDDAARVDGGVT